MRFWVLLFIFVYLAICLRSQHLPQQIRPDHPRTTPLPPIAQPHLVPPDNVEERKRKKIKKPYWKKIDHIKRGGRNFICLFYLYVYSRLQLVGNV